MFRRIRVADSRNYCFYSTLRVTGLFAGLRREVFTRLSRALLVVRDALLRLHSRTPQKLCAEWAWLYNHHVNAKRCEFRVQCLRQSLYCELRRIVVTPARCSDQSAD